jgi:hypothetical protein
MHAHIARVVFPMLDGYQILCYCVHLEMMDERKRAACQKYLKHCRPTDNMENLGGLLVFYLMLVDFLVDFQINEWRFVVVKRRCVRPNESFTGVMVEIC